MQHWGGVHVGFYYSQMGILLLPSLLDDLTTPPQSNCAHLPWNALPSRTEHARVVNVIFILCIFAKDCLHCNVCISTIIK